MITGRPQRRIACHLPRLALLLSALAAFQACSQEPADYFQGYAEGDFVLVAAPLAGRLDHLGVSRGQTIAAGDILFVLEREAEAAAVREAEQNLQQVEKVLADQVKGLRPTELESIRARLEQAQVARDLAFAELERRDRLYADRLISAEERDQALTAWRSGQAQVAQLAAELATARLGARSDAVQAAAAAARAAAARLEQARWALAEKSQAAPAGGLVFDTLFEPGEFVPAGRPVVNLLPPTNIKVRFFVRETVIGTLHPGQRVRVAFDGATRTLSGTISFISPRAEFTPPVIYSRETRSKLVYLVEARPDPAEANLLNPGQPVEVRLEP